MEFVLVDRFGWSLKEIDETDMESLIPFVFEFPRWKHRQGVQERRRQVFADQADWL